MRFLIGKPAWDVPTYFASAKSISNCVALADAICANAGSVLRSILREASLDKLCDLEFRAMLSGSKCAASSAILVVSLVTSEAKPPIVPAKANGVFESAINKLSGSNLRSILSRVVNLVNFPALTTRNPPIIYCASNACNGCPSSSIT